MTPKRIQLSRRKGWRMPAGAVKVDRTTRWGNPVRAGLWKNYSAADAVRDFRRWVEGDMTHSTYIRPKTGEMKPPTLEELRSALRGKDLACWCRLCPKHAAGKPLGTDCPDCAPCHADVLLGIGNA